LSNLFFQQTLAAFKPFQQTLSTNLFNKPLQQSTLPTINPLQPSNPFNKTLQQLKLFKNPSNKPFQKTLATINHCNNQTLSTNPFNQPLQQSNPFNKT
jgi:hypothetical protein